MSAGGGHSRTHPLEALNSSQDLSVHVAPVTQCLLSAFLSVKWGNINDPPFPRKLCGRCRLGMPSWWEPHAGGAGVPAAINQFDNMIKDCHNAHTYKGQFCKLDNFLCVVFACIVPNVFLSQVAQEVSILYERCSPHSICHE